MTRIYFLLLIILSPLLVYAQSSCIDVTVSYTNSDGCLPLATFDIEVATPVGMNIEWEWQSTPSIPELLVDPLNSNFVTVMMSDQGEYYLLIRVFDSGVLYCELVETFNVNIPIIPVITPLMNPLITCDGYLQEQLGIQNSDDYESAIWFVEGVNYEGIVVEVDQIFDAQSAIFYVTVIDLNGCEYVQGIPVTILEGPIKSDIIVSQYTEMDNMCQYLDSTYSLITDVYSENFDVDSLFWIQDSRYSSIPDTIELTPEVQGYNYYYYDVEVIIDDCHLLYNLQHNQFVSIDSIELDFEESAGVHCTSYSFVPQDFNNTLNSNLYNYTWEVINSSGGSIFSPFNYAEFTLDQSGYYDLRVVVSYLCVDGNWSSLDTLFENYIQIVGELEIVSSEYYSCLNDNTPSEVLFTIGEFSPIGTGLSANGNWTVSPGDYDILFENTDSLLVSFSQSNEFSIQYSIVIEGDCEYTDSHSIDVGMIPTYYYQSTLCAGALFNLSGYNMITNQPSIEYSWSSSSEFVNFTNVNISNPQVSFEQEGVFPITLTLESSNGCVNSVTYDLEVENAYADFSTTSLGFLCGPVGVEFVNYQNDNATDYLWNIYEHTSLGETNEYSFSNPDSILNYFFNNPGVSDIELIVESAYACYDTLKIEDYVHVEYPLPSVILEPNWVGCDTLIVDIIDNSNFIDSFNWVDLGFGLILDYSVQDTNTVMYTYTYGESTAPFQEYYINLQAEYNGCGSSFQDTVRIYPEPIIQISASDLQGCPPFEVSFMDSSIFAPEEYSEFFWDFGDGNTSVEANPTHIYTQEGLYQISHSVSSPNGCSSDTVWEEAIEVFENPVASFIPLVNPFCYGMGDVLFQNNSNHDSDSLAYVWSFGLDSSFVESPTYHYDSTNTYHINLHVEDSHGCIDDSTQWVYVEVLDTLVIEPDLQYVTVTDNGVIVVWSDTLDNYFENIGVYHQTDETAWNIVYYSDSILPNEFFHDDVATFEVNDYTIVQQDSCGYFSDSSVVHSTIVLSAASPWYQTINLEWSRYYGWDTVESYDIYRSVDGGMYQFIAQVPGDTLTYQENYLCNVVYGYYVVANHPEGEYQSRSNKKMLEPLYIDYTIPVNLIYTSVNDNDVIIIEWQSYYLSTMIYYNIDRWDDYFGWIENYDQASESPYIDAEVGVNHRNYLYRVSYADVCGNEGPNSGLGKNILLDGVQYTSHYELSWNAYIDWDGGVSEYIIQYYNQMTSMYQDMNAVSGTVLNYTDTELTKEGVDTSYCYRVVAVSAADQTIRSYSNSRCFTPGPRDYFPNAFSPNDDGLNEVYMYHGQFAKELNVEIYSRWGALVYSSDEVSFEWAGINQQSGETCPQGTYIFRYEMKGYDGTLIKDEMVIFLLR